MTDQWMLSFLPTTPFLFLFNCVGVLQHGNSWRWMDSHSAQRGRQCGLPESVEGVQDGEKRQIRAHRHSPSMQTLIHIHCTQDDNGGHDSESKHAEVGRTHSPISIKQKLQNCAISKTSCFKMKLPQWDYDKLHALFGLDCVNMLNRNRKAGSTDPGTFGVLHPDVIPPQQ